LHTNSYRRKTRRIPPKRYYTVEYEHIPYGHTQSRIEKATYFQLESAQEAMMKMIRRGNVVTGLNEQQLF
jgi:hypothetical protein